MATYQSVLTPISNFFLLSEVVTIQQTDSTAHKLKPRSFNKSTNFWTNLADFHIWCEPHLTVFSDFQVCCHFWVVLSAKSSITVPPAKQSFHTSSPKWLSLTITLLSIQGQLWSHCLGHHSILIFVSAITSPICQILHNIQNIFIKEADHL